MVDTKMIQNGFMIGYVGYVQPTPFSWKECNVYILTHAVALYSIGHLNDKDVTPFNALRKLHNEKLNDLYCSPNVVRVINSRMRWAGL
jgi:hypothetical protein